MDKHDLLMARQPIYNRDREVVAYEILFRDSQQLPIKDFDENRATSRVLLSLFTETDIETVTGGCSAFINFTKELIESPPLIDPDSIVIEVLENIEITPELIKQIKHLKDKGFTIALDDFVMEERYRPLLDIVDIIKLELPELEGETLTQTINELKPYNIKLLAEKVETPEQFKTCLELGCDMFQGYFLSRPEEVKGSKISGNRQAVIELISTIQDPKAEVPELTQVIAKDPSLSFGLLKIINSAAYRRTNTIESIHMAVNLLGVERIKSWASLLALSKIEDKPHALHQIALVRALVCEKLAENIAPEAKEKFYTVGLLSCLDAFFDTALQNVIAGMALEPTVADALSSFGGKAGLALHTAINFEQSHWHSIHWEELEKHDLHATDINELFYACTQLARELYNIS